MVVLCPTSIDGNVYKDGILLVRFHYLILQVEKNLSVDWHVTWCLLRFQPPFSNPLCFLLEYGWLSWELCLVHVPSDGIISYSSKIMP